MKKQEVQTFKDLIYDFCIENKRVFPWRSTTNPYRVLVSEVMLQQTQAGDRTIGKYEAFLRRFPTIQVLANASLRSVLKEWQGLGYNRRAKALHDTARIVVKEYNGKVSREKEILETLPGIWPYTASAILVFAFNKPVVVLETNIRSVLLHHFFDTGRKWMTKRYFRLLKRHLMRGIQGSGIQHSWTMVRI